MRARSLLVLAALLLLVAVACGDDDQEGLPPGDDPGLEEVFRHLFDPLELEYTRGGIVDQRGGKHLQLYVEPTGPATDEDYLDLLLLSSRAVIPFVFAEYPDLDSFDLCLEPVPTAADGDEPPDARTVVLLSRDQAASVEDWSTASLADLIIASRVGEDGHVGVDGPIGRLPGFLAAQAEAGAETEGDPPADMQRPGY